MSQTLVFFFQESFLKLLCFLQVTDLRLTLQRAEQQQARKEDYLREEISDLQQVTKHARQQMFIKKIK